MQSHKSVKANKSGPYLSSRSNNPAALATHIKGELASNKLRYHSFLAKENEEFPCAHTRLPESTRIQSIARSGNIFDLVWCNKQTTQSSSR